MTATTQWLGIEVSMPVSADFEERRVEAILSVRGASSTLKVERCGPSVRLLAASPADLMSNQAIPRITRAMISAVAILKPTKVSGVTVTFSTAGLGSWERLIDRMTRQAPRTEADQQSFSADLFLRRGRPIGLSLGAARPKVELERREKFVRLEEKRDLTAQQTEMLLLSIGTRLVNPTFLQRWE